MSKGEKKAAALLRTVGVTRSVEQLVRGRSFRQVAGLVSYAKNNALQTGWIVWALGNPGDLDVEHTARLGELAEWKYAQRRASFDGEAGLNRRKAVALLLAHEEVLEVERRLAAKQNREPWTDVGAVRRGIRKLTLDSPEISSFEDFLREAALLINERFSVESGFDGA